MKKILTLLTVLLIYPAAILLPQDNCKITYISNEGFLIEYNGVKVIIDGIFGPVEDNWCDSPAEETANLMRNSLPPFDNIDLIATTHYHRDHFDAGIMTDHLLSNSKAILICPEQTGAMLKDKLPFEIFNERIISYTPASYNDTILRVAGFEVRMMRLEHSHYMESDSLTGGEINRHRDVENVGYLFTINGRKFFHCGDTNPLNEKEYEVYALNEENIDVAFIERLFYAYGDKTIEILNKYINPQMTFLMHINPANRDLFIEYLKSEDDIIIFKEGMESVIINLEY